MKIRQSFVTNSSSSSYIIAIKKDATFEEFKEQIDPEPFMQYLENSIYNEMSNEEYFYEACKYLYDSVIVRRDALELDNWAVINKEVHSEDIDEDSLEDILLWYNCIKNSEKVKIG